MTKPRFPFPAHADKGGADEALDNQNRPRRSLIKFAGFEDEEVEEPPEESQPNKNTRPGLLRAPTPYPKELRALAKHASQVYTNTRQVKDQNGDVVNTVRKISWILKLIIF